MGVIPFRLPPVYRSQRGVGRNTLTSKVRPPATSAQNQAAAYTPKFLDILKDSADYADFHSKCRQILEGKEPTGKGVSLKNCRFCS